MALIKRVAIRGMHGRFDVDLALRDRHCIIVGPNGSGKSTALQILSSALGRQWKRLSGLPFSDIEIGYSDGRHAVLSRETAQRHARALSGFTGRFPPRIMRTLREVDRVDSFISDPLEDVDQLRFYTDLLRMPTPELSRLQTYLRSEAGGTEGTEELRQFVSALEVSETPPVYYLPTSRRIEIELESILQRVPEAYRASLPGEEGFGQSSEFLIELIRFGMEDVTRILKDFEEQTRDFARNQFNRMMSSYLKEMANSQTTSVKDIRMLDIDSDTVALVLNRIEEGILSQGEKDEITSIILELASGTGGGNPPFYKKWLAHFFVRLLQVSREIASRERPARALTDALDKYFRPDKRVVYNVEKYHLSVKSTFNDADLPLAALSSGEKQLVSLLTQLHFSKRPRLNVMIDEPELSLSVPWQADFLPDIANTAACQQIFAVTHSPFIYDNMGMDIVDFLPRPAG